MFTQKELNLQQRRYLEFLKDDNMSVLYHHGKANVVAKPIIQTSIRSVSYGLDGNK